MYLDTTAAFFRIYQNILIFLSTCEISRPFWNPQAYVLPCSQKLTSCLCPEPNENSLKFA